MVMFETLERRALLSAVGVAAMAGVVNSVSSATAQAVTESQPAVPDSVKTLAITPATNPTTQAVAISNRVSVYSWHQPRDAASFNGMVWVSIYKDPVAEANRAAPILKARQPGDRAVFLGFMMDFTYRSLDRARPTPFLANGLDVTRERGWSQMFFGRLKALGVPLDRVVLDSEHNFSTWYLLSGKYPGADRVAYMETIYKDSAAYAKLPAEVRAFAPADFASTMTERGRSAVIAWNRWAFSMGDQAVGKAVVEPVLQTYGANIVVGNYGDFKPTRDLLDKNGWPLAEANASMPGNVSSAETYIWEGLTYRKLQKDWRWNRVIDVLNKIRACQNVPGVTVTPWISFPSFRGDGVPLAQSSWLWEHLVAHMAAGGVQSFYYWNPKESTPQTDDQVADALFKRLKVGQATPQSLQPIAFDADEIVTGSIRTTYAQFLKYVDDPNAHFVAATQPPMQFIGPTLPGKQPRSTTTATAQTLATQSSGTAKSTLKWFYGPTAADKVLAQAAAKSAN